TTVSFPVIASGSSGILLELVNQVNVSIISGVEITAANAGGDSSSMDLEYSLDNGGNWTPIAQGLASDRFGDGSFSWTPDTASAGNTALIRASSTLLPSVRDVSDQPFLIAPTGHDYYVNDATSAGDLFTTTPGNNFNSGKSPSAPMATLAALLSAYDLAAGDVVHVDAGSYTLLRNILIASDDAGVRIEGANLPLLNRANVGNGTAVFDLQVADNVTIDGVQMTGAVAGINQFQTQGSDHFTLSNSRIFGNSTYGINLDGATDFVTITGNTVFGIPGGSTADDQRLGGILILGSDATITNNSVYDHTIGNAVGMQIGGNFGGVRANVSGNDIYGNYIGVFTANLQSLADADKILISGNKIHDNLTYGVDANSNTIVSGNNVFGSPSSRHVGIRSLSATVDIINNIVFENNDGIVGSSGRVIGNRAYGNVRYGISISGATETRGNLVYSNSIGIQIGGAPGPVSDNVVYGNTNQGIYIQNALNTQLYNNTVYQSTGEAVRIEGGSGTSLRNNIIWVLNGYDIFLNAAAQTGFTSNYNILNRSNASNARIGFWGSADRLTLADWQGANGQDANSLSADPLFIDIDGADNVFGGNGGLDDNFYLSKNSPAIDRGDSWRTPLTDQSGAARADDPGTANAGSPNYVPVDLGSSGFAAIGTARNFRANGNSFQFTIPFAFPFYDASYTTVTVSTEGTLVFGIGNASDGANSDAKMLASRRISPLWDNIHTLGSGDDIFIDTATAGQATFRWNATNEADNSDVNFSTTLFSDGRIRFHYGAGNTNLTPTIGISMGNNLAMTLPAYNGQVSLTNANSIEFAFQPGIVDIGAYEFRGSSNDVVPPTITGSTPSAIHTGGATSAFNNISLSFSEPINPIDAAASANYELRSAGPDLIFDNADDVILPLTPGYTNGALAVDLAIGGLLFAGNYRFTA
ncbi:MAG TPA: right-handed parallel beta-helix repeat-containing protein, partial [Tepidisphaeraceae bacterium]|nr:right-handed parallel beta-helix repeat-containing protein [Tepidisphaeraceae bacterium]